MKNEEKFYVATTCEMLELIKKLGSAKRVHEFLDENDLWQTRPGLPPELKKILALMPLNEEIKTGSLLKRLDGISAPLLVKRLKKLQGLKEIAKTRYAHWMRIV